MARFTNQAQLRYGNAVANSNIAVGEILEVLSATKTAVQDNYGQNDSTYIISIVNAGNTAFNGLTIEDNLGSYTFNTTTLTPLTYVNGTIKYYINECCNRHRLLLRDLHLPLPESAFLQVEIQPLCMKPP